jgi:hypothetical protein
MVKVCPTCKKAFPASATFCRKDKIQLITQSQDIERVSKYKTTPQNIKRDTKENRLKRYAERRKRNNKYRILAAGIFIIIYLLTRDLAIWRFLN